MIQFLTESAILSACGGIIGVALAVSIVMAGGAALQMKVIVRPSVILMAVSFSAIVGIFFGIYPASKAAKADPIDALRYVQKLLFVPYVLSVIQLYKIYIDAEYKDILLSISQSTRLKYLLFDNILWIMIWIPMFIYLYVQNSLFYISIVYIIIQQFLFMSLIYLLSQISLSSLFVSGITIIYILICSFATNDIPVISYMHDIIPYVLDFSYLFSMILISILCLVGGYVIEKYTYRFLK